MGAEIELARMRDAWHQDRRSGQQVRVPKECQVSDDSGDRRASISTTNAAAAAEIGREAERLLTIARLQEREVTAKAVLKQAAATLAGPAPIPNSPTLADYLPEWMAHHRHAWKKSTRESYESIVRNHLLPTLGDVPLDEITRRPVRRWVGQLAADGLSRKTISNIVRCLSSVLSSAVHDEILTSNPVMRLRHVMPRVKKERRNPRAWHPQQMERILEATEQLMPTPELRALIPVLEATGLRIGEALGLQWDDLDLETGQLEVRRARVRSETTTTSTGGPYDSSDIRRRYWYRVVKRAKVPNHGFHGFRHYRASRWLLDGQPVLRVARWLGHASAHTTLTTYAHILDEIEDRKARGDEAGPSREGSSEHPGSTSRPRLVSS